MPRLGVFTKPEHLEKLATCMGAEGLDFIISTQRKECELNDFEIGISYCFPYKVDTEKDPRLWINYHPAPLPKYKGFNCFADQINDRVKESAVTMHRMTNELDSGPMLAITKFKLVYAPIHSHELWLISHYYMFQLFRNTITDIHIGKVHDPLV